MEANFGDLGCVEKLTDTLALKFLLNKFCDENLKNSSHLQGPQAS